MSNWEIRPGLKWRTARRITQALALIAVVLGPVLGGWQRGYRGTMSAWRMTEWDLPLWLIEMLPNVPSQDVYAANKIMGGGTASDYLGIPASDPLASTISLLWGQTPFMAVVAWAIPILLALLFGRVFCGWFCPFGTLARAADRVQSLLPFKHRGFEIPKRRPVRWAILGVSLVGGLAGGQWLSFVFLPHALLQNAGYALILLGGLGAVGGAFLGLFAAGLIFGPSLYCAAVCPTGAFLGLLGRRRVVHVQVIEPQTCGSCTLCHRACWLGLQPAQGDPGPDCDLCTRCFTACPRDKMVLQFGGPRPSKAAAALVGGAIVLAATVGWAADWDNMDTAPHKPTLVLNGVHETDEFTVAATIIDLTGTQFTLDTESKSGIELSLFAVKGSKAALDREGHRAEDGELPNGPARVTLEHDGRSEDVEFEAPNHPISTPNRSIYRRHLPFRLKYGDKVTVHPMDGIFSEAVTFTVPDVRPARDGSVLWFFLAGVLVFGGLLSLALGSQEQQ